MNLRRAEKFFKSMQTDPTRVRRPPPAHSIQYRMFGACLAPYPQPRLYEQEGEREEEGKEEDESSDSTCLTSEFIDKFDIGEETVLREIFSS